MKHTSHYNFPYYEKYDLANYLDVYNNTIIAIDEALYNIENDSGEIDVSGLEKEIKDLSDKYVALNTKLNTEVDTLNKRIDLLPISEIQEKLATVESSLTDLSTRVDSVESTTSEQQKTIDILMTNVGILADKIDNISGGGGWDLLWSSDRDADTGTTFSIFTSKVYDCFVVGYIDRTSEAIQYVQFKRNTSSTLTNIVLSCVEVLATTASTEFTSRLLKVEQGNGQINLITTNAFSMRINGTSKYNNGTFLVIKEFYGMML